MASSGWQGEQFLTQRSSNISYYGNLYISSISRSGTNITINGTIRLTSKGTSGHSGYYNYGVQADPDGSGGWGTLLGNSESLRNGNSKDVGFSTTVSNVSTSATTLSFGVRYCAWYNSGHTSTYWDVTKTWSLSLSGGSSSPSGLSAQFVSATEDTVTLDISVGDYGNPASANNRYIEGAVLGSTTYGPPYFCEKVYNASSGRVTITNNSSTYGTPMTIEPNTEYHIGIYANNTSVSASKVMSETCVTAPASITAATATYTGNNTVNIAVAHGSEGSAQTVYTEYSWDNENWVQVSSPFNVTVTSRKIIFLRRINDTGSTPVYSMEVAPTNGNRIYGSVSGLSKNLSPLYASFGNYFDSHHWLPRNSYASVDISGNDITITKVSSGSGTMNYIFFLIDATDEIINKEVTISGDFITGGSYTSGPRLFWMKSDNVNWLSLVSGMEYGATGAQHFSLTGTIPSRPSGAGKLGLGLYSNQNTAAQGAYTIYRNVELKANVKNMFNYLKSNYPSTKGGVTVSRADDGTFTATGILSTNYQVWGAYDITDQLEDGCTYTFSQTNNTSGKFYMQMPAHKRDGSGTTYYNIGWATQTSFVVDKTTYDKYTVQFQTGTTSQWGTTSQTITQKFQLEKGGTATSFAPFVDTKTHKLKKVYGSVDGRAKLIYQE